MISWLRRHFSALIIVLSIAAVLIIAFSNQELENAWDVFLSLHPGWLLAVLCCWMAYAGFEGLGSWFYLRSQGFRLGFLRSLSATMIGFFYSNVTPSAAGGQPMQVHSFRRAGVPVGYGTTAVTIRFICNQFAISVVSLVMLLLRRGDVYTALEGKIWFFRVGWLINFGAIPVVLLAAFHPRWIRALAEGLLRLLTRLKLLRRPDEIRARVWDILELYHTSMRQLMRRPGQIVLQLLCSLASVLGMMLSIVFVYRAFGLRGTDSGLLLTLSAMLFVSASYTPLPGASGAQEGGFLLYFNGIFTDGIIGLALLVWRFFTYYLFLITGIFFVIGDRLSSRRDAEGGPDQTAPSDPDPSP